MFWEYKTVSKPTNNRDSDFIFKKTRRFPLSMKKLLNETFLVAVFQIDLILKHEKLIFEYNRRENEILSAHKYF